MSWTTWYYFFNPVEEGSPTPGPWTGTAPRPVRKQATQQEVSSGEASEALSAAPHRSHYRLNHPPCTPRHSPWKNCLPRNRSLVSKRLGTAAVEGVSPETSIAAVSPLVSGQAVEHRWSNWPCCTKSIIFKHQNPRQHGEMLTLWETCRDWDPVRERESFVFHLILTPGNILWV